MRLTLPGGGARPRMPVRLAMLAAALGFSVLLFAGCTTKTKNSPTIPTLSGTEIPTVSPVPATAAICTPPEILSLPANVPADVTVPPDIVVFSVKTTPFLHMVLRVTPPSNLNINEPRHGVVANAILQRLTTLGWTPQLNPRVDGLDYTFKHTDGRAFHLNAIPRKECGDQVQLTYDLPWITP